MDKIPIIIDTDPGIDDTVALAIAINQEKFDIKLISTVARNANIDLVTENALKIITLFNANIEVSKGCYKPILRSPVYAYDIHGNTELDGYDFKNLLIICY
ncbi:nucleoside hydrolase [Spiroplasma taiwanense]|uniref:nucleoside hydrolase n=1 Tax=Spiroplasma taiwanense TaxID=2145 RepID=UPI0003FCBF02|nr:nucleoside hydrolase [Spiroplasma taiwanense]